VLKYSKQLDLGKKNDTLIIMHKGSEGSRSTTPPLSANAILALGSAGSPPEESKGNISGHRMTFNQRQHGSLNIDATALVDLDMQEKFVGNDTSLNLDDPNNVYMQ